MSLDFTLFSLPLSDFALIAHHYMLGSRSSARKRGRSGNSATLAFSSDKVYHQAEPEVTALWILIVNNDNGSGILSQCNEHRDCISIELLPAISAVILHSLSYSADDKGGREDCVRKPPFHSHLLALDVCVCLIWQVIYYKTWFCKLSVFASGYKDQRTCRFRSSWKKLYVRYHHTMFLPIFDKSEQILHLQMIWESRIYFVIIFRLIIFLQKNKFCTRTAKAVRVWLNKKAKVTEYLTPNPWHLNEDKWIILAVFCPD